MVPISSNADTGMAQGRGRAVMVSRTNPVKIVSNSAGWALA
jgi:hypothetical protein